MKNHPVAVMGYPDKLNEHRLSTNRTSYSNIINNKSKTRQQ